MAAAFGAGLVNAVAGGGTLISFPTLVALGVPAVSANITNTVSLCPGYLGGAFAQRAELRRQADRLRALLLLAMAGGLAGSVLLVISPDRLFRSFVPFLILLACGLLATQDLMKRRLTARRTGPGATTGRPTTSAATSEAASTATTAVVPLAAMAAVGMASIYGGYFGAGLGIMLLAVLGLAFDGTLTQLNSLKQALSLVINVVAAGFFVFSGKVEWGFAAVMAVGSLAGGNIGGRIAGRLNPKVLRAVVIVFGVAVAIRFWL